MGERAGGDGRALRYRERERKVDAPPDLSSFRTGALTFRSKRALMLCRRVGAASFSERWSATGIQ